MDRLVSHDHYVKRLAGNSPATAMTRAGASLTNYVERPPIAAVENGQVRYLARGCHYGTMSVARSVDASDLGRAIGRLNRMFVRIAELFPETMSRIATELGWRLPSEMPRALVNQNRPTLAELTEDERDAFGAGHEV